MPDITKYFNFLIKNKTVFLLGLVSLFADISSEMLYPITPIFLTTVIGTSMFHIGLIEGIAEFIASLTKNYSGILSDRWNNRKFFVALGYFLAAISKPIIGMSHTWTQVLSARSLDRLGKGIRGAPRDAWLVDSVHASERGRAFGWHRAMDNLGAFIGPLLAIALLTRFANNYSNSNLSQIYWIALIPGLIATLLVILAPQKESQVKNESIKKQRNTFSPELKKYLFCWIVFSITNSSDAFLMLKAHEVGFSLTTTILFYCGYNLITALSSPYLGHLADKIEKKKLLIMGFLTFAIVYAGFSAATELWQFIFLFLIYGLYNAATDGVGKAMLLDFTDKNHKASTLGFFAMTTGFASLIASSLGGLLWQNWGSGYCFILGSVGATLAAGLLSIFKFETTNKHSF